ncbi:hypothetical protein RIF29_05305 [Crotalaria pallida]|uniref:Uncharacterized protein n=1 Tax=Crotalaria pallida TaxID=3830 RepID=A0AAN9PAJ6_CROPI
MKFVITPEMTLNETKQKIAYYAFGQNMSKRLMFLKENSYLDTYQAYGKCNHKKTGIWILANCISTILPPGSASERIGNTKPVIRDWPISSGSGVPECGNSMHSALYVLDWITMQQCFQPNVFGLLDENVARMTVAMKLLLSSVNEVGAELKLLANEAVMT